MSRDLTALFCPKSIAVIGASRSPEKVGAIVLKNIINSSFSGAVYPINPNYDSIGDLICFKDINSVPETVDLVVIATPAEITVDILSQIGESGTKNVVVFAAGFKEIGEEGAKLEKDLIEVAKKYELNLLGPNCLGFVNNNCPVNATFGEPVNEKGNLRFISQSGAIAASLFDWCNSTGLGLSEFVTLGNKAVLNENDILEYFQKFPKDSVTPIGLYLESIANGSKFLDSVGEMSKKDPVFVLKPGRTQAAAKAMQSHTGAIAGEDDVLEAVLERAGVIRCDTLEDFFDLSRAFSWGNIPKGPRVAIVSNAGGPAVISSDAVITEGLELANFDEETKAGLEEMLPRSASIINPVDVLGDALADRFVKACETIFETDKVDSLVVILTPQIMTQIEKTAEAIGDLSKKYDKPVFCSFIGGNLVAKGEQILNEYEIPSFRFPERAISALGTMWDFRKNQERKEEVVSIVESSTQIDTPQIEKIINTAIKSKQKILDNMQANEILSLAGIPTPPTLIASTLEEAEKFAQECGWPIVLKLSSPGILHKKNIGGVIVDIRNKDQLEDAWIKMQRRITHLDEFMQDKASLDKQVAIQVQKDIVHGVEVLVGVKHDPTFGPVLLFGAGGSLAELIADKNLQRLPVDVPQAKKLVEGSKVFTALEDTPPHALNKLYDVIVSLSKLASSVSEISEIEVNPVIVTLNDVWAVDGKVVLKEGKEVVIKGPQLKFATTARHDILAAKYHSYTFESEEPLVYKPGQYISVKVAKDAVRCYSIAGNDGPNKFDLLVDTTPGGPGSKFFESLKVGDKLPYLGPFGKFMLNLDDGSKHLLFLATGCGCSPIKSMINYALKEKKIETPITLYFGLRCAGDVFWQDYFKKLSEDYSNFTFKMAADKKEGADSKWNGHIGFITDLVKKDFPDASECSAYLCGSKPMLENAINLLKELGVSSERIYTEKL